MSALAEKLGVDASVSDDAYLNIRQKGQQRVMQFGFPDTKTEAWKYTSLRSMEKWQAGFMPVFRYRCIHRCISIHRRSGSKNCVR